MTSDRSAVRFLDPATTPIPEPRKPVALPGRHVLDAWGDAWRIAGSRETRHGFELFLGRPAEASGPMGAAVIITAELAAHFEAHRRSPQSLDLPIGKGVVTRIRAVLGHHRYQDAEMWWHERIADLERLTLADFSARHRVSASAVSLARSALLGPRQRPANWWRTPEMQALLMSKQPTAWIALQTGLSAVTVRKYRAASQT